MPERNGPEAMVSSIWSPLFFGHERDTLHRVGQFVGIYSISVVVLFSLGELDFDRVLASQTAADLGVYSTAGSRLRLGAECLHPRWPAR